MSSQGGSLCRGVSSCHSSGICFSTDCFLSLPCRMLVWPLARRSLGGVVDCEDNIFGIPPILVLVLSLLVGVALSLLLFWP